MGSGIVDTPPGSVQGMQMVVSDINAARAELVERGVEVSEVQEFDWGSFVFFSDPDGNGRSVQQLPVRD
jgi:predicted enzyme related to lactoylglutathione lyase